MAGILSLLIVVCLVILGTLPSDQVSIAQIKSEVPGLNATVSCKNWWTARVEGTYSTDKQQYPVSIEEPTIGCFVNKPYYNGFSTVLAMLAKQPAYLNQVPSAEAVAKEAPSQLVLFQASIDDNWSLNLEVGKRVPVAKEALPSPAESTTTVQPAVKVKVTSVGDASSKRVTTTELQSAISGQ